MPDGILNKVDFFCLLLWLSLGAMSCQRKSDFFFVRNEGAVMPVKISGSRSSNTFVILLPGGPAGDGLVYRHIFPFFRKHLETQCAMVYYDQRGAGNCRGTYDTTTLNLQQLSADLDKLITTLHLNYGAPDIYLLGYSYGGALGITYVLEAENQGKVSGLISLAGAFDRKRQQEHQAELINYSLQDWTQKGIIDDYDALKQGFRCADQAEVSSCRKDSMELRRKIDAEFRKIEKLNRFQLNSNSISRLLHFALFSQSNPLFSGRNELLHARYFQKEFDQLSLSDKAQTIRLPVLIINGRWDTNVPFFAAQDLFDRLGTPDSEKRLLILEGSGHLPQQTEPEELARAILGFIGKSP